MIFPVKTPYTITADISKYVGPAFNTDPSEQYISQKRIELDRFGKDLCKTSLNGSEFVMALSRYCGFKETEQIEDIAMQLEEDIAILHKGILKSICFCFPSGFVPGEKIGMNFFDTHIPVADGEKLRAASQKVTELISKEGSSFRRYVWTISSLPSLSQHPAYERTIPEKIDDLYFRTEVQTTVGAPGDLCFFFVKVDMVPLRLVWDDLTKRESIVNSINSMSEAVLNYKKMKQIKFILNNYSTII